TMWHRGISTRIRRRCVIEDSHHCIKIEWWPKGGFQALARLNHDHSTPPSLTGQAKTRCSETESGKVSEIANAILEIPRPRRAETPAVSRSDMLEQPPNSTNRDLAAPREQALVNVFEDSASKMANEPANQPVILEQPVDGPAVVFGVVFQQNH